MSRYRIRPVTLSRVLAEKGIMTFLSYYGEKIWRPYTFWIIEGADKNILVDTAIHAEDYKRYHTGFRNLPIEHRLSFEEGLSKASLKPDDIDLVIQTHLHFDHCYNTSKCKKANVLVQEEELRFAKKPHPVFSTMYSKSLLQGLKFETIRGRKKILPGIEVIPVPGHTPGCQAVAIETKAGRAIITGFCCIKENFDPPEDIKERVSPLAGYPLIIPGIHFDAYMAYESLRKIKRLADILLPVHEPELMNIEMIPDDDPR
jgi:N-acyl homoserine lactone hydrolase